ncbi:MAG: 4Fe-4S cluster-binding domain-containing protein [Adlercreutzia sp.]
MTPPDTIRLYGTAPDSIVDGPGCAMPCSCRAARTAVLGAQPRQPARAGGTVRAIADVVAEIAANKLVQGVTVSGGEPFEQAAACAALARQVRELGLDVDVLGLPYEQLEEGIPIRPRAICSTRPTCWWTAPSSRRSIPTSFRGAAPQPTVD